jgi:hypothetical protein
MMSGMASMYREDIDYVVKVGGVVFANFTIVFEGLDPDINYYYYYNFTNYREAILFGENSQETDCMC